MTSPRNSSSQSLQFQRSHPAGRFAIYFLCGCSAILLYSSFKLESGNLEAWIQNSVTTTSRTLPEEYNSATGEIDAIASSDFYVPSLDYRIKGISQYIKSGKDAFEAHVYCEEFEKDLLWEWWRPNDKQSEQVGENNLLRKNKQNRSRTTKKRLLIGISSGYDFNARLLERAAWSARVYGALWSGDSSSNAAENMDVTVVVLQGTAFSPHGCKAPPSHASIDKIRVLFEAIDSEDQYDRLLLLDADAMIYGMDMDLTSMIGDDDDFVVMGPPILEEDGKRDKNKPWHLSTGVTLWNLEHHLTRDVALDWFNYAKNAIIRGSYRSDQKYLHKALQQFYSVNEDGLVTRASDRDIGIIKFLEGKEFDHGSQGTIVKQFGKIEPKTVDDVISKTNIHDKQMKTRLSRMEETAQEICNEYPDACTKVGAAPRYYTS